MTAAASDRIATLDLIRGIAVLGILTVNIASFSGPALAVLSPHWNGPATLADKLAWTATFVLFEGKMRLLFTLLFGASMALFIDRADAAGRDGPGLQAKRLGWLLGFGLLHYALLWDGDILALYAMLGFVALALQRIPPRRLAIAAVIFFVLWHATLMAIRPLQWTSDAFTTRYIAARAAEELAVLRSGFFDQVAWRAGHEWFRPFDQVLSSLGETVPLMLIGVAMLRSGAFSGGWPRRALIALAAGGIATGLTLTAGFAAAAWLHDFPAPAVLAILLDWNAVPQLLSGLGYAALLILIAPRVLATRLGERIAAAGRMAFSNYLGTSLVMTAVFSGWGLGLVGRYGAFALYGFVAFGWVLMLAWSKPWLARYRQGPLEWLWRSLTEGRALPFRR